MFSAKDLLDLFRTPARMFFANIDDQLPDSVRHSTRALFWPTRQIVKSNWPETIIAFGELVTRLPTNPKFSAEIGHSLTLSQSTHKLHSFRHWIPHFPRHGLPPCRAEKRHPCVRSNLLPMYPVCTFPTGSRQSPRRRSRQSPRRRSR